MINITNRTLRNSTERKRQKELFIPERMVCYFITYQSCDRLCYK